MEEIVTWSCDYSESGLYSAIAETAYWAAQGFDVIDVDLQPTHLYLEYERLPDSERYLTWPKKEYMGPISTERKAQASITIIPISPEDTIRQLAYLVRNGHFFLGSALRLSGDGLFALYLTEEAPRLKPVKSKGNK